MARKKRGQPVHGWVNIDKTLGKTSTQAVGIVRRAFDAQKAGHSGTLDPLATGVLPIALGEATKTIPFVMDGAKSYRFTVRWGEAKDTDDGEGSVIATSDHRPDRAAIEAALPQFTGVVKQVPPRYSAIKIDGQRAYDLARADEAVDMVARPVRIDALSLVAVADDDHAEFALDCGKGTYVRSLARDLAIALKTVGHVSALRRTRSGPFTDCDAISLAEFEQTGHMSAQDVLEGSPSTIEFAKFLHPVVSALDDIPALNMTESEAARLRHGQPVPVLRTDNCQQIDGLSDNADLCALLDGEVIALLRLKGRMALPVRVLNL